MHDLLHTLLWVDLHRWLIQSTKKLIAYPSRLPTRWRQPISNEIASQVMLDASRIRIIALISIVLIKTIRCHQIEPLCLGQLFIVFPQLFYNVLDFCRIHIQRFICHNFLIRYLVWRDLCKKSLILRPIVEVQFRSLLSFWVNLGPNPKNIANFLAIIFILHGRTGIRCLYIDNIVRLPEDVL